MPEIITVRPPARLFMGPGPSMVAPRSLPGDCRCPSSGISIPTFSRWSKNRESLRSVFATENEFTLAVSGTGSGGMECAVSEFHRARHESCPSLPMASSATGSPKWARRQGAEVVRLEKPWASRFNDEEAREFIRRERPAACSLCAG